MRYLNEKVAGENGFIQLSADGNSFQTENGKPMRFWSINGINKIEKGIKVYPNPSNGSFRVEIVNYKPENYSLELLCMSGEKIWELKNIQHASFEVKAKNISDGFFLAVLKNEK